MKVILFGATGMVGQGVLRECLLADDVSSVLVVGRSSIATHHAKLRELLVPDVADLSAVRDQLSEMDACFFCLGISSVGVSEADYKHITYDIAVNAGALLAELNPGMTFVYVSGEGTSETGRSNWSRVKAATENALLAMPLNAFMFRPGIIQPLHGITSRTKLYRVLYRVAVPLFSLIKLVAPKIVTSTESIGQAMLTVARTGAPKRVLASRDINGLFGK